jgi:hypothetical protein
MVRMWFGIELFIGFRTCYVPVCHDEFAWIPSAVDSLDGKTQRELALVGQGVVVIQG